MAAVGDVFSDYSNDLANGGYLDAKPAASHEATVHNIYHESDVELYWTDGTNEFKIDADTSFGAYAYYAFHVTNSIYLRIKNVAGSAKDLGFDGVYTKVA